MKILLLGKNGQVGWELQRALATLGEVVALDRHPVDGLCGDLGNLELLSRTIRNISPDVIVNAAAYTAVDKAETDRDNARLINAQAVKLLAQESARLGCLLVHYSTDYVFDGKDVRPWRETDAVAPVNFYGATKLEGEQAIQASGCDYLIFRTSWVYGARGNNFARTMLKLATDRTELKVIADQIGAPTGADLIADVTAIAIRQAKHDNSVCGIYHLAASGFTSWHEYATLVINMGRQSGLPLANELVTPIPTEQYPTPARRPLNSRLNTEKLRQTFSIHLPTWQSGVTRMLKEVLDK
ncbi:dTDP-4-dehydrorhamnose reductase [Pseudomonas fluorescens]|uniref:dTDP-4-dehydrorhamnose reductase n=1 Tax=Pseudomonas fluorescens TaxID=294 RepID=A0A0F4TM04_PSEFL|nr:dTDP-4-dehydrorhamnose reductase [Pseudomonas fluorescens]KJZ45466.1 dTDP-4-dehydrorhamnose reductase [Pseudomonas fluorescens]